MKRKLQSGLRVGVAILVGCLASAPLCQATGPAWWTARGVLNGATADDYGAVNQGQVKNIAAQAKAEMDANLPGGAGSNVLVLVNSFSTSNNYLQANIGQLKNVAKPYYDRLIAAGYPTVYPWTGSTTTNDYASANIGQIKNLFSWDLTHDSVGDGIPDWWRAHYFGGSGTTTDDTSCAACDPVNDSFTNLEKFQCSLNPLVMYSVIAAADVISNSTGNTASVPTFGWTSYVWSISGGTITAGQGTTNITWTAGGLGSATISVTISNSTSCNATLSTTVTITPIDPTLTTIYTFTGSDGLPANGFLSQGPLVQGCDNNFYSALFSGGANGLGSVFQVTPSGTFTTMYSFTGGSDQASPAPGLVLGSDGNFYDTTFTGGYGIGTVFKMTTAGTFTTLYSFSDSDGCGPWGLVEGIPGDFYGAVIGGCSSLDFHGSAFEFSSSGSGSFATIYSFTGSSPDYGSPAGALVRGTDGNLYGTTAGDGRGGTEQGVGGTVFRIDSGGFTTLHTFAGQAFSDGEGGILSARLVQGTDGNFYGVTPFGGDTSANEFGWGTVFKISPSGTFTSLHTFNGSDGGFPWGPLIEASDGNFYGVAESGGDPVCQCGTVFQITTSGNFANLYNFKNTGDRFQPVGGLVQGTDGNLYGLTGPNDGGSIFKLTVPFNPPPNQISGIHLSGTDVVITIPSIAGESYQLQYTSSLSPPSWTDVVGALVSPSLGGVITLTDVGGALHSPRFYRVDITNCDGDTFTDAVEYTP
jgi:uncharacterized repeat protein (TIGR03803 family)